MLLRFVRINELLVAAAAAHRTRRSHGCNGAAFGAGADIACACAVRLGAPRARFRFPGFQFGVALGTRRLVEVIGSQRAREVLACNEEMNAEQAQRDGLLAEVIDDAAFAARPAELARSMRGLDAVARRTLLAISGATTEDADLADLVRSVARPGIHARIARYRQPAAA